jgi:gliding motility-associated lipoprotein GldD
MRLLLIFLSILVFASCGEEVIVKPAAKLRLEYNIEIYAPADLDCPFTFEKNSGAKLVAKKNCAINIEYPQIKATVYLTYQEVNNNLKQLLNDAQKLTYEHTVKADEIFEQPRKDTVNNVYGMFYIINGDAATQSQFYVTDSVNHFVKGALYFDAKPKFDSIYPAVVYLREDIRKIMETISWEE